MVNTPFGNYMIDPEDEVSKTLVAGKMWEQDLINAITPYLSTEKEVIEVGSYIGDHTVYLSKRSKFVWAFEASKQTYAKLLYNLDTNGCRNVIPFNLIVGTGKVSPADYTKEFKNDLDKNPSGYRFVEDQYGEEAVGLDTVLLHKVKSLSLLKVDCEGMDYEVICSALGLINKFKPLIAYEYNWYISNYKPEDVDKLLKPYGYNKSIRVDTWNWLCTMQ